MPRSLARAKVNLFLRVVGRRDDGYHELEMVNVSLDLADTVEIEPGPGLALAVRGEGTDVAGVPGGERNLAVRAARAVCAARGVPPDFRITLTKRIPAGAGLAGGSTDAAAVLRLLGEGRADLPRLGLALGADVPYCLDGCPAVVKGIGEIVEPIVLQTSLHLVVANPGFEVATKSVFAEWSPDPTAPAEGSAALVAALARGDLAAAAAALHNDLQPITARRHPEVAGLIAGLTAAGAVAAMMSGSGPTVFGLFADSAAALAARDRLVGRAPFLRCCTVAA